MEINREEHSRTIRAFEVRGLLGLGGTSFVLAAIHPYHSGNFTVEQKVALKFIWDIDRAKDELERLVNLDGNRGVSGLIDYFEVTYREIAHLLEPAIQKREEQTGETLVFEPDHVFGVLALQFAHGQIIVKTVPLPANQPKPPKDAWLIEVNGQPYLQSLTIKMTVEEKINLMRCLIKIIKSAHEREPAQVHGDLHPGNLMYNREDGEAIIIDWSGNGVYGTDGWITPWHDQLLLGEIQSLPKSADIYLLALWLQRLLGAESWHWQNFAVETMSQLADTIEIPIQDFFHAFEHISLDTSQRAYRRNVIAVSSLIVVAITALLFWFRPGWQKVAKKRDEIDGIVAKAIQDESYYEKAMDELALKAKDPDFQTLRDDVMAAVGAIKLHYNASSKYLERLDLSKPNCVFISQNLHFVVYGIFPFSEGAPVSKSEYITKITYQGIWLGSKNSSKKRLITFKEHPLPLQEAVDGVFLIYESDLREVLAALGSLTRKQVLYYPLGSPRIVGVIIGSTPEELLENIITRTGNEYSDEPTILLGNRKDWTRCWEVQPHHRRTYQFSGLLNLYLRDKLGYKTSEVPQDLINTKIDLASGERADYLQQLQLAAKKAGYWLKESQDGTQLTVTATPKEDAR